MIPTIRSQELRQALFFVRLAREYTKAGKLADAVRYQLRATRTLAFVLGAECGRHDARRGLDCTATLRRVVRETGEAIEEAVRVATQPVPPADETYLIDDIAAGIDVLRTRDGVPITEEDAFERARNIAALLLRKFELRRVV